MRESGASCSLARAISFLQIRMLVFVVSYTVVRRDGEITMSQESSPARVASATVRRFAAFAALVLPEFLSRVAKADRRWCDQRNDRQPCSLASLRGEQ
jgi:hypothetical protein